MHSLYLVSMSEESFSGTVVTSLALTTGDTRTMGEAGEDITGTIATRGSQRAGAATGTLGVRGIATGERQAYCDD